MTELNGKKLTGRIAADRIRMTSTPKPPAGAVERFLALGECTSLISDVMDELGIPEGAIGATTLRPTLPGKLICGPALTVRNIAQRSDPFVVARQNLNKMAEFEAHNLAEDGDVLVISGVSGMSNMGGISALTGQRQGERGAIVMGGIRDVAHSRSVGYPLWASEITPVTGKWRLETVEINGEIQMGDVRVNPGCSSRAPTSCGCWSSARRRRVARTAASARSSRACRCRCSTTRGEARCVRVTPPCLMPPLGMLFGFLLLGEHVSIVDLAGIVPVALGIYLVTRPAAA